MTKDTEKFADAPLGPDTIILQEEIVQLNGLEVLYQYWAWSDLEGHSLILPEEDAKDLDDEALLAMVPESKREGVTLVRSKKGFTFINYGFCDRDGNPLE